MENATFKTALIAGASAITGALAYWGYCEYAAAAKQKAQSKADAKAADTKSADSKTADGKAADAPVYRVVLTGGPCGGKSSALDAFTKQLKARGFDVFMVPEVPTLLLGGGCRYPGVDGPRHELLEFERHLIAAQLALEDAFVGVARSTGRPAVVIHDRGAVDVAAYLPAPLWQALLSHGNWSEQRLLQRYDLVVHLVTAADGAERFYTTANNATRSETPAAARDLDAKMRAVWKGHKRHVAVDNSTDFKGKLQRATDAVLSLVDQSAANPAAAAAAATGAAAPAASKL